MPRDKEIQKRDAIKKQVMDVLTSALPHAQFKEFKFIPRVSGIIVSNLFGPDKDHRRTWLRKTLGELETHTYIRLMTPEEYEELQHDRRHPMD